MDNEERTTPPRLTESEADRLRLIRTLEDSARRAGRSMDFAALMLSINRLRQVELRRDLFLNAIQLPTDAGVYSGALRRLLIRIPDGSGRWVNHGRGWYRLVTELDAELAKVNPDYVIIKVKEKFGVLRFNFSTRIVDRELHRQMRQLVASAESASAKTCEECGECGDIDGDVRLRNLQHFVKTLCEKCAVMHPRWNNSSPC